MTPRLFLLAALAWCTAGVVCAQTPRADLPPPAQRAAVVALARELAQPPPLAPLPDPLPHPLNPPGFDQPDPAEVRAAAVAAGPAAPPGDREVLAQIAARIHPSGTIVLGGEPMLIFHQKRLKVGDHLGVAIDKADYDVEISAIDSTTFTLRLNGEEITCPIRPGKNP